MSDIPITPPMILQSGALFTPRVSKLKPSDPPTFYLRALATEAAVATKEWKSLERTVNEFGAQYFGDSEFKTMLRNKAFRSPFRRDVHGKGWPENVVQFISLKSGAEYPPAVLGRDGLPIMDRALIYPGCTIRMLVRIYGYGGKGSSYAPGIAFGLSDVQKLGDGPRLSGGGGGGGLGPVNDDDDLNSLIA